jgi:hypothetical protein
MLKEDHRLRVFVNREKRKIFVPKREGVRGYCRRVHNEKLPKFKGD